METGNRRQETGSSQKLESAQSVLIRVQKGNKKYVLPVTLISVCGVVVMILFLITELHQTGGQLGFPLDDTWIHVRFADNLFHGQGFSYNPGESTPGDTSPLWVVLLAGCRYLGNNWVAMGTVLSGLFFILTAVMMYGYTKKLNGDSLTALFCGLLTLLHGRFAWCGASGMETTLFTFLSIAGIWKHSHDKEHRDNHIWSSVLFGLATLARPEGYLLYSLAVLDWIFTVRKTNKRWLWQFNYPPIRGIIFYALVVAPYLIFSYHYAGHPLPNTFAAKGAGFRLPPDFEFLVKIVGRIVSDQPVLGIFLPLGFAALIGRSVYAKVWNGPPGYSQSNLWFLWGVGLLVAQAFVAPILSQQGRYTAPVIPIYVLIGVEGISFFCWAVRERVPEISLRLFGWRGFLSLRHAFFVLALAYGLISVDFWTGQYGWNVSNINDQQVAMGKWIRDNTPANSVIAVNDIGAIGFFSGRRIIDMCGLVSPDILPLIAGKKIGERDAALISYLASKKPDYVVIYPEWYPVLVQNTEVLNKVLSIRLEKNTICGGDEKVAYKTDWSKYRG